MYLSIHAPVGIILAQQTDSPILAFLIGIISHFVLDIVPHGDSHIEPWVMKKYTQRLFTLAILDLLATALIIFFLLQNINFDPATTLAGLAGAVLPDFIWGLQIFLKQNKLLTKYARWHRRIHHSLPDIVSFPSGLLLQFLLLLGLFALNFK